MIRMFIAVEKPKGRSRGNALGMPSVSHAKTSASRSPRMYRSRSSQISGASFHSSCAASHEAWSSDTPSEHSGLLGSGGYLSPSCVGAAHGKAVLRESCSRTISGAAPIDASSLFMREGSMRTFAIESVGPPEREGGREGGSEKERASE